MTLKRSDVKKPKHDLLQKQSLTDVEADTGMNLDQNLINAGAVRLKNKKKKKIV